MQSELDAFSISAYGYNTKRTYTQGYFNAYDPRRMSAVAAVSGQAGPDPTKPFTYADFGSGFGMTALLLARALPHGQFYAIDFIEEHITTGRRAAELMGVENITYVHAGFDSLGEGDLPPLDYATAHGILSWVSAEVRGQLRRCLDNFLKPTGLFLTSFNHIAGWGDTIAARELFKAGYDMGLAERGIRDLTLSIVEAGVSKKERSYPSMLRSITKDNLDYLQHELLNNHWTCFTCRQVAEEMEEIGFSFIGPWLSPMQIRPVTDRPLGIEDRLFWEDAFFLRTASTFQRMLFAKEPLAVPPLTQRADLPAVHFTLSPTEKVPPNSKLAETDIGTSAPYGSMPLTELGRILPDADEVLGLDATVRSSTVAFTSRPVVPVEGVAAFVLSGDVKVQFKAQAALEIDTPAISVPAAQAVIDLPGDVILILKRCAGKNPADFARLLAGADWIDEPTPAHNAAVESWTKIWAPWLAGLGAIEPMAGQAEN